MGIFLSGRRAAMLLVALSVGAAVAQESTVIEVERIVSIERPGGKPVPAQKDERLAVRDVLRTGLKSRAVVKLNERAQLRVDQLTELQLLGLTAPELAEGRSEISIRRGITYIFSREPESRINIKTMAGNGALRGTQLIVSVRGTRALFGLLEGELDLSNSKGRLTLRPGEFGEMQPGRAPRRTAVIAAKNILQWALYYPAVLDPTALGLTAAEESRVAASLKAYRAGDLLGALEKYPLEHRPASKAGRLYLAGVLLAVGRVDDAREEMGEVEASAPGRRAIEKMIAAVNFEDSPPDEPVDAAGWIAQSYYEQSKSRLTEALAAAKKAVGLSPENGYAWTRVAELQFSFGRTPLALDALERGMTLTPRNAQAHAARGFVLSAQNRIAEARDAFDEAIALDGALGNGWLGRGLAAIRKGDLATGTSDLQTAATLEPQRAIFHSYLGKAYSQAGDNRSATKDLDWAKTLDPHDPTPWLYSAIQKKQENRYNAAIDDIERSIELNDNRRVYRSRFLLDQDQSIRGTNLAAIYQNNGMTEQSVREAVRAVGSEYSSAPAHLFLANSYNALRDPTRILLRYETAWFNELLLANLLSPVGGGPLSQFVSEQEYSKLFEKDGLGLSTITEYFSDGKLRETASQYGTFGNLGYALDAEYQYDNGRRPNNDISRLEAYATFKLQLGPQDTLFFQTKYEQLEYGDVFQNYDPRVVGLETSTEVRDGNGKLRKVTTKNVSRLTADFTEHQDPALILAGWRHEWSPGNQTLLLLSRLANDQVLTADDTRQTILSRDVTRRFPRDLTIDRDQPDTDRPLSDGDLRALLNERAGSGPITKVNSGLFDLDSRANFETYGGELAQILTLGPKTLVFGGRYQRGQFETNVRLDDFDNGARPEVDRLFKNPPAKQSAVVDFERINLYFYDLLRLASWLEITGGLTYDSLRYPENFRSVPVSERQLSLDKVSPKSGFTLLPWRGAAIRGAYAEAISGPSFDESIRLEPTQVNGFLQAYRTVISESLIGSVGGSEYRFTGLSFEQKLPSRTYLGVEFNILQQDLDRTVGVFDALMVGGKILGVVPSSVNEKDSYREDIVTATVNQLVGEHWAFGTRYRYTRSRLLLQRAGFEDALDRVEPELEDSTVAPERLGEINSLAINARRDGSSGLHELSLYAHFNHPGGFFARADANWYQQENNNFIRTAAYSSSAAAQGARPRFRTDNVGLPGDEFWHFNVEAGWRFHRNQCEVSCGVLNLTGADYRLEPLNSYAELPRDRTLVVRCKLTF